MSEKKAKSDAIAISQSIINDEIQKGYNEGIRRAEEQYEALMQIVAEDRISMLADISVALAEMLVSILQINSQKLGPIQCLINISVSCKNLDHFNNIVSKLKSIKGVHDVTRGYAK
jgi:(p)ppGpp synthase/HD superfamily hydrolase